MQLQTLRALEQTPGWPETRRAEHHPAGADRENLLSQLTVRVDSLAFSQIAEGYALIDPPLDEITVHFVLAGSGSIEWDGGCLPLERGTIAVIPRRFAKRLTGPGIVRSILVKSDSRGAQDDYEKFTCHDALSNDLRIASAKISANLAHGAGLFDSLKEPVIEDSNRRTAALFESIFEETSRPRLGSKTLIEAAMKQILLLVLRSVLNGSEETSPIWLTIKDHTLARVVNQINANPGHRHTLRDLARGVGVPPADLAKKFQVNFGQTPLEFMQMVRINAAKIMLENTRSPIKCIAGAVGFASRSHFSREFTRITGQDPTSFRRIRRSCDFVGS